MPVVDISFFEDQAAVRVLLDKKYPDGPKNIAPVLLEIILAAVSSPLFRLLIELTVWTNVSISNLLEMTYGDLKTIEQGWFSIYYTYGAVENVPISKGLQEMLLPYVGKGQKWDFIFTHEDGSTWSEDYVKGIVKSVSEKTGIDCTFEDLHYSYYRMIADSIYDPKQKQKKKKFVKEAMKTA